MPTHVSYRALVRATDAAVKVVRDAAASLKFRCLLAIFVSIRASFLLMF